MGALSYVAKALAVIASRLPLIGRLLKFGARKSASSVWLLFQGGLWTWVGISVFVVAENWTALTQVFTQLAVAPLVSSLAANLTTSYADVVSGLGALPSTQSWSARLGVTWSVVTAVAHIAWYFRAWATGLRLIDADVAPLLVAVTAVPSYGFLIWGATGTIPVVSDLGAFQHLPELVKLGELVPDVPELPLVGGGGGGNVSDSAIRQPLNASVNGSG